MSEQDNQPIFRINEGDVRFAVWKNKRKIKGKLVYKLGFTFSRIMYNYSDKTWKYVKRFRQEDLKNLKCILDNYLQEDGGSQNEERDNQ